MTGIQLSIDPDVSVVQETGVRLDDVSSTQTVVAWRRRARWFHWTVRSEMVPVFHTDAESLGARCKGKWCCQEGALESFLELVRWSLRQPVSPLDRLT